jgi:hypothetical protein
MTQALTDPTHPAHAEIIAANPMAKLLAEWHEAHAQR